MTKWNNVKNKQPKIGEKVVCKYLKKDEEEISATYSGDLLFLRDNPFYCFGSIPMREKFRWWKPISSL